MTFTWDPDQYHRYRDERLRPGFELIARIEAPAEGSLVDLGCGTGEHLAALAARFPGRASEGVDLSEDMLGKARTAFPALNWRQGDIASYAPTSPLGVLFSNAALQWLDGHEEVFPRLFRTLTKGGVFAVQMPSNLGAPAHELAREISLERGWIAAERGMFSARTVRPASFYYDLLRSEGASELDLWETTYVHQLGPASVTDWLKGTGLRPILSAVSPAEGDDFLAEYDMRVRKLYPPQADGVTLYPQNRLFILARR
jgi:trans-aconitate 2-methyltransferase